MRTVAGLTALACSAALLLTGCGDTRVDDPPRSSSGSPSQSASVAPAGATGRTERWIAVDSSCGVQSVEVDGRLWLADPPLGDGRAPAGWAEETWGHFIPGTKGRAMFRGEGGQVALFRKAGPDEDDPAADCG